MLKMAGSINLFAFAKHLALFVLISAVMTSALPLQNQEMDDGEDVDGGRVTDSSAYETVKRSSDLSDVNENESELRNDESTRTRLLVQRLSNILHELKQAKLTDERAAYRDMIFNKNTGDNEQAETSSQVEEAKKPLYNVKYPKNKLEAKRDCHLGLGMGYLCHAYSITKYAQHHKLMQDRRNPGK